MAGRQGSFRKETWEVPKVIDLAVAIKSLIRLQKRAKDARALPGIEGLITALAGASFIRGDLPHLNISTCDMVHNLASTSYTGTCGFPFIYLILFNYSKPIVHNEELRKRSVHKARYFTSIFCIVQGLEVLDFVYQYSANVSQDPNKLI